MRIAAFACLSMLLGTVAAGAQDRCRVLCAPEFSVEPTITFSASDNGRDIEPEVIFSFGVPTRVRWFELTFEAIVLPFDRGSTPELELEANFVWLPGTRTGGWVSSHVDVVNKFSAADHPADGRAYTHKLNLELDTGVAVFNWMREGRWLRGVEVEGSLDYVTTGEWSFSIVFVLPIAPM